MLLNTAAFVTAKSSARVDGLLVADGTPEWVALHGFVFAMPPAAISFASTSPVTSLGAEHLFLAGCREVGIAFTTRHLAWFVAVMHFPA